FAMRALASILSFDPTLRMLGHEANKCGAFEEFDSAVHEAGQKAALIMVGNAIDYTKLQANEHTPVALLRKYLGTIKGLLSDPSYTSSHRVRAASLTKAAIDIWATTLIGTGTE